MDLHFYKGGIFQKLSFLLFVCCQEGFQYSFVISQRKDTQRLRCIS
jgi:hypothetical protein